MFNLRKKIRVIRAKWKKSGRKKNNKENKIVPDPVPPVPQTNLWSIITVALFTVIVSTTAAYFLGYIPSIATTKPQSQSSSDGRIKGNKKSRIYHLPKCPNYDDIAPQNIVWFRTEEDARKARFRKARNC